MGRTLTIKCPKCGKRFDWRTGSGFLGIETLHCEQCGKEKSRDRKQNPVLGDIECKCGGIFTDNAPVRCPKYKKVVEDVSKHMEGVLCWD